MLSVRRENPFLIKSEGCINPEHRRSGQLCREDSLERVAGEEGGAQEEEEQWSGESSLRGESDQHQARPHSRSLCLG